MAYPIMFGIAVVIAARWLAYFAIDDDWEAVTLLAVALAYAVYGFVLSLIARKRKE